MNESARLDMRNLDQLQGQLERLYKKAVPYAVADGNVRIAFDLRNAWQGEIQKRFVLRNQFTKRSIQVERGSVARPTSTVGSTASYMKDQEFGKVERKKGRHGVAIPTKEARIAGSAKRMVRRSYRVANIKLTPRQRRLPRKARNAATVAAAIDANRGGAGRSFVFMDLGARRGLFSVRGKAKRRGKGGRRGVQVRMVQDLSHDTIRIPSTPTLEPAIHKTVPRAPEMYRRALLKQIDRQNIFQNR
jgi:hypothetical protein